ncbi:MAG: hypothetical protein HPY66_3525 [Firmicutes bacterium]|nr:hypothetical protein [Bacillota bacterium]MDI6706361.1 GNAT family N-acetyltransferase [Bacillota bacterium]
MLHFRRLRPGEEIGEIAEKARLGLGEDEMVMLAFDDGELVGICSLTIKADTAWLNSLYICEEKRKQGIGTGLLKSILFAAKNKGAAIAKITEHRELTGFLLKMGFCRDTGMEGILQADLDGYFKCCNNALK